MIECDLHNYRFKEAIEEVIRYLRICWKQKINTIRIIHGYHGHVLKDYIESSIFLKDMKEEGFIMKMNKNLSNNPGVSVFNLKDLNSTCLTENWEINSMILIQKLKKLRKNQRINIHEIQF